MKPRPPAAGPPRSKPRRRRQSEAARSVRPQSPSLLLPASSRARWALAGILAGAFLLRTVKLLALFPILVDESIYLRWAEIIDHQGSWFVSLLDGKPPLSYWLLALGRKLSDADPLWQARLLSALAGVSAAWALFALVRRLAPGRLDDRAGLLAAGFYSILPWALLYDRLAYTEAWVNLFGVLIALTSVLVFEKPEASSKRVALAALAFGLALFTKQTALLFGAVPGAIAWRLSRHRPIATWLPRLAVIYGGGALFLTLNFALTPAAPMLETHDVVLHHRGFFADPNELLADPLHAARSNAPKLAGYVGAYLSWPLAAAALVAGVWLLGQASLAPWLLLAGSLLPWMVQVFVLELIFPTRYAFPHAWPWIATLAAGASALLARLPAERRRLVPAALAAVALFPLWRDVRMLAAPEQGLHPADAEGFLGDHAHVGYGIREAVAFLERQARQGPYILLTDPIWGPPADAMFPYLNRRHGIQVYEAWWTQLSSAQAILPAGRAEVLKSHYERTPARMVDFTRASRVFYITDTHYYPPSAVRVRQPGARLAASFPKLNGHAIHVYRLK